MKKHRRLHQASWIVVAFAATLAPSAWMARPCVAAEPVNGVPATQSAAASRPAVPASRPTTTATAPATRPETRPATGPAAPPFSGPNVIILMSDDQAAGMTGFEGHKTIKTPNLDRLAAEGVYFSRYYVPTPQCAPSRATLLTGQYPHTHGVTTNGPGLATTVDTLSARLKKAGYACGIVGKWHLPYEKANEPGFGFTDDIATDDEPFAWRDANVWLNGRKARADKYLTDWHGDRAIEFVEKHRSGPFFLWVSFRAPHEPLDYPPGMESLYPPASIELPKTMQMEANSRPAKLNNSPPARLFTQKNEQALREARSKYYAMITKVDENVGRLMKRLDELQLSDKTIVVFASDNGWAIGDHRLYAKGPAFYEELVRSPLLIRYPAVTRPGMKIERIVGTADLAPTLLQLVGLPVPITMQGSSVARLLRDPEAVGHADEEFFEYHKQPNQGQAPGQPADYECPARGIVTPHYKFIDYLDGSTVLYDLKRDPDELTNVGNDPHYAAVVKVLRERLNRWRKDTRDPTQK